MGIVGVAGRASGQDLDVRRDHPYAAYDSLPLHVPVYQEGSWSLVRIASDGSMEYAVPPRPGADVTENPYVLPTGGGVPS